MLALCGDKSQFQWTDMHVAAFTMPDGTVVYVAGDYNTYGEIEVAVEGDRSAKITIVARPSVRHNGPPRLRTARATGQRAVASLLHETGLHIHRLHPHRWTARAANPGTRA